MVSRPVAQDRPVRIRNAATYRACPLPCAGEKIEFSAAKVSKGAYVTFVSGLSVVNVKAEIKGKIDSTSSTKPLVANAHRDNMASAGIPAVAEGHNHVFVTSKDVEGSLDDTAILFGPAILAVAPQPPTYDLKQE